MSLSPIDAFVEPFYVPHHRRIEALLSGDGNADKYSDHNLTKGVVSWALRSGEVDFQLTTGRTLRSGKVTKGQPGLLKKLKVCYPNVKNMEAVLGQVLDELPSYEKISDGVGQVGPWDGTWYSDAIIPRQLKEEMASSATKLEASIPNSQKDWHYGADQLVLNLVHPSLYCVNADTTRILKKDYRPTKKDYNKLLQHEFNGDNAFVPRTEVKELLSSYDYSCTDDSPWGDYDTTRYIHEGNVHHYSRDHYLDTDYQWLPSDVFVNGDGVPHFGSYINNLFDPQVAQNVEKVLSKMIPLFERTLTDLYKESRSKTASVVKLNGRKIQVIVTMSNIILTPETPNYPGGRLHVDGMDNEQIVAVGIFYYSTENISESRLALSDKKIEYGNGRSFGSFQNVSLGSIETKEGRCFVFPNNIQHQVLPFELADPTRPGHRKRLTFFLVDPSVSILSTARVPPQQKSWWIDQLKEAFSKSLPPEIVEHIGSFCISSNYPELERAREHRDKMAKHRTVQAPSDSEFCRELCGD